MDFPDSSVTHVSEGLLAQIDSSGRAAVPASLLKAVGWHGNSLDVLVELYRPGHLRLFGSAQAEAAIRTHLATFDAGSDEELLEVEQVLADRYRRQKLYADGRITLVREVCAFLEIPLGQPNSLFVQSFDGGLSIMSMAYRLWRLEDRQRFKGLSLSVLQSLG